jgi:hypothetical protein
MSRQRSDEHESSPISAKKPKHDVVVDRIRATEALLKTVLGGAPADDTHVEELDEVVHYLENGPKYILCDDNLHGKEELIYVAFCNLNNWIAAMKRMRQYEDLDLLDNLLSNECKDTIYDLFRYRDEANNPVKCIRDIRGRVSDFRDIRDMYVNNRKGVAGFCKLMRDCNAHLKDDHGLNLSHSGTMKYLLCSKHPSGNLIPKLLRFIYFVLHEKYPFWFGASFDSILPLFCNQNVNSKDDAVQLFMRMDAAGAKEDDDIEYKLLNVFRNKPFYRVYQQVTKETGIRLFKLQALIGSKRVQFSKIEDVVEGRVLLCIPTNQDVDKLVKKLLNEHEAFPGDRPQFEKIMLRMEKDNLWNDSYDAEMALQDTILYFIDTYKFILRLLQASDSQKRAWKSFLQKNIESENHLIRLASLCMNQENATEHFQENIRLSPSVNFE